MTDASPWWRSAAIYQIYPRSYADGNADGVGDIAGIRSRLAHLRDLGVDALWISPWYVSPMADAGYDVADYRDIDPLFGTLREAEELIAQAHSLGLRVIVDLVPNHCSDQHPWFQAALTAGPGSPERSRFHFRPGRGESGALPPNDWPSHFGGPAWQRVTEADGTPGEWYLHLFAPGQPDFNWDSPAVRAEFESILRFWFDRGVDGFRIDVADNLVKHPGLPDLAAIPEGAPSPVSDQDGVHEVYRAWRRIADSYDGERIFVGELWVADRQRFIRYLRADELHTGFNFPFLQAEWSAERMRAVIDDTLAGHTQIGAPATWVLSNHDTTRHVTRYGRADSGYGFDRRRLHGTPVDLPTGTRRARAAALLTMALPGCVYVYQGDELGLWEVEDIPEHLIQDPAFHGTDGADPGRDGCRVPIPWEGDAPPFGFNGPDTHGDGTEPWLPQPAVWKEYTVAAQTGDPDSMLELYRRALRLRRAEPGLGDGPMRWLPTDDDGVLAFTRPGGLTCVVNFSRRPVELPPHEAVLLSSNGFDEGRLPPDSTVWLRT
ncbi:alpha-amylase family glycosyl hydrolase [Streptomyces sp. R21]|uniref:Alpha-amylase family glycosyl hydrolase n=1 Tax=Streptomyces sp. R21 TaxID=3238627 RepID=A0AB39P1U7_9ACTN